MEPDLITKLNNNVNAYNEGDYDVDASSGGGVPLINTANTTTMQSMPMNLAGGIEVNGKSYSPDQIEELFEMVALIKKVYPELVIVK
jgi:N-acetyl-anhydromuramyl-L-alanine amidase AmpD